jgi:hypothetical protein
VQNVTLNTAPRSRALEFGIYRDGDNNLDLSQSAAIAQALQSSRSDAAVEYTVENATHLKADEDGIGFGKLQTQNFTIADGEIGNASVGKGVNMASEANLAKFVAQTLDNAEASGAKQTWIDLVDHGGGDGGGLETHTGAVMSMPDMAQAIADGVKMHAQEHPEDANRNVDGVVANQCLMSTLGFADALSAAEVKYLAASPETMVSPGVPTTVADAIAHHTDDPQAMARGVVREAMRPQYGDGSGDTYGPAAAFDVLDISPGKIGTMRTDVKALNDAAAAAAKDPAARAALRDDVRGVDGMARMPDAQKLPWRADRPAIAAYDAIASDDRLNSDLRAKAATAKSAVSDLILAHKESGSFDPLGGASYRDAVGPTVHLPTAPKQIDPWASHGISETKNAFYKAVDGDAMTGALA